MMLANSEGNTEPEGEDSRNPAKPGIAAILAEFLLIEPARHPFQPGTVQ